MTCFLPQMVDSWFIFASSTLLCTCGKFRYIMIRNVPDVKRPRRDSLSDGDDEYQQRAPRRGWATPTYEEKLEEKRQQERRYR